MADYKPFRKSFWLFCLILNIGGLASAFLLSKANRVYYVKERKFSVEARKNPFLALEYFLAKQQISVNLERSFTKFNDALMPEDTIIITNSRRTLSKDRLKQLQEFVQNGGHLLLNAVEIYDEEKASSGGPFMDELGARLRKSDNYYSDDDKDSEFYFEDSEEKVMVTFSPRYYLQYASGDSIFSSSDEGDNHLLQYHYGEGMITLFSDIDFVKNNKIDQQDNALFMRQLIGYSANVWLFYDPKEPGLLSLFWKHGSPLIIAVLTLLLAIFWYQQIKTGPVFAQFSIKRRKLMQHIRAASEFKWSNQETSFIINQLREELYGLIRHHIRQFDNLKQEEQLDWLYHKTHINKQQISRAMFAPSGDNHNITKTTMTYPGINGSSTTYN